MNDDDKTLPFPEGVPNLDCEPHPLGVAEKLAALGADDVRRLCGHTGDGSPLFGVRDLLVEYCQCLRRTRMYRHAGEIERAQPYEARMEVIYKSLPEYVRW